MSFPLIEVPLGLVNGFNRDFEVNTDYVPDSVRFFRNGVLLRRDLDNGWWELGGKRLRLKEIPLTGDVLQVYYLPL
jgi:hypothetical protein